MSAVVDFNAKMDDVRTAIVAQDYVLARQELFLARTYSGQFPNSTDEDGRRLDWRDGELAKLSDEIDRLEKSAIKSRPGHSIRRRRVRFMGIR